MKTKSTWVYAAGAAVACAGIIGVSTLAAHAGTTPQSAGSADTLQFGSGAAASADPSAPAADPSAPAADPSAPAEDPNPGALGTVVRTGIGKWVLYGVAIDDKKLPKIKFGVMAGTQAADGKLKAEVMSNETTGSGKSAGFHAVEGSMGLDAGASPTFGYYVGAATKITGVVGGKTVTAGEAAWSEDSSVHFFWFAPSGSVSKLAAFDKSGHKLPTGNASVAVG